MYAYEYEYECVVYEITMKCFWFMLKYLTVDMLISFPFCILSALLLLLSQQKKPPAMLVHVLVIRIRVCIL